MCQSFWLYCVSTCQSVDLSIFVSIHLSICLVSIYLIYLCVSATTCTVCFNVHGKLQAGYRMCWTTVVETSFLTHSGTYSCLQPPKLTEAHVNQRSKLFTQKPFTPKHQGPKEQPGCLNDLTVLVPSYEPWSKLLCHASHMTHGQEPFYNAM